MMEMTISPMITKKTPIRTTTGKGIMLIPMTMEMVFQIKKKIKMEQTPMIPIPTVMASMMVKKKKMEPTPTILILTVTESMMAMKKRVVQTPTILTLMEMGLKMAKMISPTILKIKIQMRTVFQIKKKMRMAQILIIPIPMGMG